MLGPGGKQATAQGQYLVPGAQLTVRFGVAVISASRGPLPRPSISRVERSLKKRGQNPKALCKCPVVRLERRG